MTERPGPASVAGTRHADVGRISHVSDTALWVAYYRHMESERPDAIFRDPFAKMLAGAHGEAIVHTMPQGRQIAWSMIVRTKVFDEVVLDLVDNEGVDLVINLAAGLDARPWRLDLPASLRWVDVDFAEMVEYKTSRLRDQKSRCRYEAVGADLSEAATRPALLARISAGAKRTLILSEGLLIYLTAEQVGSLAADLAGVSSARWWLIDLASPRLLAWMNRRWGKKGGMGTTQFKFAPDDGTTFFSRFGWNEDRFIGSMDAASRLKREMKGMWFWRLVMKLYPKRVREQFKRFSGYVLLVLGAACAGGSDTTAPAAGVSVVGSWSLKTVNGATLPYLMDQNGTDKTEMVGDVIVFLASGQFTETAQVRSTAGGQVSTVSVAQAGTWATNKGAVALTFAGDGGTAQGNYSSTTLSLSINGLAFGYTKP